jgi:NADP-dependent 3-hydroxy acid dehydrogenase YdfG
MLNILLSNQKMEYAIYAAIALACFIFLKKKGQWFTRPRFMDKTVWITGASSGIGEQLALAFSRAGANVILSARSEARLQEVKAACMGNATVVTLDLSDPARVLEMASKFCKSTKVDILVNNGGIS